MSDELPTSSGEPAPSSAPPPSAESSGGREPAGASGKPWASTTFLLVVTVIGVVADLASKAWAKNHFDTLAPGESRRVEVIEGFMNFIFAKNRGGAWGLFQDQAEALRRPFFIVVSVAAIIFIVSLYRKLQPGQLALKWGLPLVLGGALGNFVDRIRYGYVVDFIDCYIMWDGQPKHWPTFNVADIGICIGVGLMAIDMFTSRAPQLEPQRGQQEAATQDAEPDSSASPPVSPLASESDEPASDPPESRPATSKEPSSQPPAADVAGA